MDRASGYGPEGWGFESLRVRFYYLVISIRLLFKQFRPGFPGYCFDVLLGITKNIMAEISRCQYD